MAARGSRAFEKAARRIKQLGLSQCNKNAHLFESGAAGDCTPQGWPFIGECAGWIFMTPTVWR
jgi:hypothetical protein